MADFGGLASVLQMQNQGVTLATKHSKSRKRSLETIDDPNARVNSKLLQLLKDNQEEFLEEQQQELLENLDYKQNYEEEHNDVILLLLLLFIFI